MKDKVRNGANEDRVKGDEQEEREKEEGKGG